MNVKIRGPRRLMRSRAPEDAGGPRLIETGAPSKKKNWEPLKMIILSENLTAGLCGRFAVFERPQKRIFGPRSAVCIMAVSGIMSSCGFQRALLDNETRFRDPVGFPDPPTDHPPPAAAAPRQKFCNLSCSQFAYTALSPFSRLAQAHVTRACSGYGCGERPPARDVCRFAINELGVIDGPEIDRLCSQ